MTGEPGAPLCPSGLPTPFDGRADNELAVSPPPRTGDRGTAPAALGWGFGGGGSGGGVHWKGENRKRKLGGVEGGERGVGRNEGVGGEGERGMDRREGEREERAVGTAPCSAGGHKKGQSAAPFAIQIMSVRS